MHIIIIIIVCVFLKNYIFILNLKYVCYKVIMFICIYSM